VSQQSSAVAEPAATASLPVEKATLHHAGINVTVDDFEMMIDWCRNMLDLEIRYKGRRGDLTGSPQRSRVSHSHD
jgi:hypothetical protein